MVEDNNVSQHSDEDYVDMPEPEGDPDESTEDEIDGGSCSNVDLEKENSELRNEIDELKNKFLRVSAEYDNYRKRTTKEKSESYNNGMVDVVVSILPILDNLERAKSVEGDIDSLKKGIDMVVSLFSDVLNRLGIEEIETIGKFDPNLHEAVSHVSDENLDENVIVEVLQKGYKANGKVIRHSMVKVAN